MPGRAADAEPGGASAGLDAIPERLIEALRRPAAYPHDPSAHDPSAHDPSARDAEAAEDVSEVQTHLSHVFLTRDRVYKLRKPVGLSFVDFRSRAVRNRDCVREVELNRRLAPDVYLGLAPVLDDARGVRLGPLADAPAGPDLEHCVVMRRLPSGRDALSLLERGALAPAMLDALAEVVARFHESVRIDPGRLDPDAWLDGIIRAALDNCAALAAAPPSVVDPERVRALEVRTRAALEAARAPLLERLQRGRAVDGHGDLHLQHVWLECDDATPLLIDCLEFSDALRHIDAAADVGFLAMDLCYRGRADLAGRLLRGYAALADDYGLYAVIDLFVSYRAAVRAKVAAVAAREPEVPDPQRAAARESVRAHVELALEALAARSDGSLVVICGNVGTGKSTLARLLADALDGVPIPSDRVRKRLVGLAPQERARGERASRVYATAVTERVYAGLLQRAAPVLASGRSAILDATYARADLRRGPLDWARERGVPVRLVEVRCRPELALERLERRERAGRDPSDAGPELYRELAPRFEPPDEWPAEGRLCIETDREGWQQAVPELAARLRQ
jgi:aminoglycoside phosphotransferase family enzyme/predicted kinase